MEIVTGIGKDPITNEPIRRVRVLCKWHGAGCLSIAEYWELRTAERVRETLLRSSEETPLEKFNRQRLLAFDAVLPRVQLGKPR